jgi:putrescine transport system permease protein
MDERGRAARLVLALVLVVLYTPLLFLLVASVNSNPLSTGWQGFTTRWYESAFDDPALRRAVGVSLRLAVSSALISVCVGTAAAVAARRSPWLRRINTTLATVRVATPEIIIATGLGAALPAAQIAFGFRPMLVAHVAYLSAYVMLIVGARAAGADPQLEEAAMDLGARPFQVFFLVTLPSIAQGILAAFLLAFTLSFDDVVISEFLSGPGVNTLPQVIFGYARRGINPTIYAAATLLIVTVTVVILAYSLWVARQTRRREREIAAARSSATPFR